MNAFDELAGNFSRLPGIGKKSAIRMVNWLLKQDASYVQHFAQNLAKIKKKMPKGSKSDSHPLLGK